MPYLGKRPIVDIKVPDLRAALRRIEARGKNETAHRVRSECGAVFRYAIANGRAERDPAADLRGALAPIAHRNLIEEFVRLREAAGLTQRDLAKRLNVSQSYVAQIEKGQKHIALFAFPAYCRTLRVSPPESLEMFKKYVLREALD